MPLKKVSNESGAVQTSMELQLSVVADRRNGDILMNDLIDTPKHKDLIYDIGMHKGEDAEFYLRKGFRVIAFEADTDLVRSCRKRLSEFVDRRRLTIVEGAILDSDAIDAGQSRVRFYKNVDVPALGTVCADWAESNARQGNSSIAVDVDAINLAGVIQEHGIPHFMKIDIEGCDMACVRLLRRFRERPDFLSVESDKTSFANIEREIDVLVDLGYDRFQAVEQSGIHQSQSPPYPSKEGEYVAQRFEFGSSGLFGSELGGRWKTKHEILRQYRAIWLGYRLLGDEGIMTQWKFQGASELRSLTSRFLRVLTKASVPGWYDTHARHSVAGQVQ
jgi:FkbM family methyltransferase